MRPPIEFLLPPELGIELLYSFVIVICSLMIYRATREMYELSSYKGIQYFRRAFLFFAIAYFFRYSIKYLIFFFNLQEIIELNPHAIGNLSLFIFLYSSFMAMFYLLYSVMWKKWSHTPIKVLLINSAALLLAFLGVISHSQEMSIFLNAALLVAISFVFSKAYHESHNKEKGKGLYFIYFLLVLFWILNIIDILLPRFLHIYQIGIYLVSTFLFMAILYKVLKRSGN